MQHFNEKLLHSAWPVMFTAKVIDRAVNPKTMICMSSVKTQSSSKNDDLQSIELYDGREMDVSDEPSTLRLIDQLHGRDQVDMKEPTNHHHSQWWIHEFVQLLIPLLIAGFGNVLTGYLLNYTANELIVFQALPQLIIVVPALLGLKGNVEMTLASRLSTHANLGTLDDQKQLRSLFAGNFFLVQCQGTTIGLIASIVTLSIGSFLPSDSDSVIDSSIGLPLRFNQSTLKSELDLVQAASSSHAHVTYLHFATVLISASVFTVFLASLVLSVLIFVLVSICKHFQCDPDNIAIPLAASVGDFVALLLYVLCCNTAYDFLMFRGPRFAHYSFIAIWSSMGLLVFLYLPCSALLAAQSKQTARLLYHGWYSILAGMALQTMGGLIMENALQFYPFVPLFQPILNGIGGNLVAIQCTRMSTHLHRNADKRQLPVGERNLFVSPLHLFRSSVSPHARLCRLLVLLSIVCHFCFLYVIHLIPNNFALTAHFVIAFLSAELLQLLLLLYLAHVLVHLQWLAGIDPDNNAIPFMTALADLLGSAFLAALFMYLQAMQRIF